METLIIFYDDEKDEDIETYNYIDDEEEDS